MASLQGWNTNITNQSMRNANQWLDAVVPGQYIPLHRAKAYHCLHSAASTSVPTTRRHCAQRCSPLRIQRDAKVSSCAPQEGGKQMSDFGQLLLGFFRRFGSHFNLYSDAVAIGLGGIVSKKSACVSGEDISTPKLCVQDINTLRLGTKLTCDFSCCCVPLSGSALR